MTERALDHAATLYDAVRAIESSRRRLAVVVDPQRKLLGTLTDGDVRRCLLAGGTLQTAAVDAMNPRPLTAKSGSSAALLLELMRSGNVLCIPLVDGNGIFERLVHLHDLGPAERASSAGEAFSAAIVMAGGEGARLRPLTESIPKPMLDIGGVPLLERHVRRLARTGIKVVYISVNYLSHVIENHFGDGSRFDIRIRYLREHTKMGTAGALCLLPERPQRPIIVMNGDIVTTSDFSNLFAYHCEQKSALTVAAAEYRVNIPYGVIHAAGAEVLAVEEKPSQRFLCNAGIYAVSSEALALIPSNRFYNMTDLIDDCIAQRKRVSVFPMHEYWSDIGTLDDLEKTRAAFADLVPDAV